MTDKLIKLVQYNGKCLEGPSKFSIIINNLITFSELREVLAL
jgi:hypothetical protein